MKKCKKCKKRNFPQQIWPKIEIWPVLYRYIQNPRAGKWGFRGSKKSFKSGVGGGWIALPNGLWHFFSEYEPLLRNQICIVFHHYLLWFPSKCHLRIMFDHSYFQNNHSQSQNRRFKEFAHFRRKIPATKRPFAWGGGGWNAIRQNSGWTRKILTWGFPYWVRFEIFAEDLHVREAPRKENPCSNGILPNSVSTPPPQANGRFVAGIFRRKLANFLKQRFWLWEWTFWQ